VSRAPDEPEPIPYRWRDRRTDMRRGRRDGRRKIPAYSNLLDHINAATKITAPYPEKLARIGQYHMNGEYIAYQRRAEPWRRQTATARVRLAAVLAAIERGIAEIGAAEAELTKAEMLPRSPQERTADSVVVLSRRTAMREKRIAEAQARQAERIELVDTLNRQIAEAAEEIDREFAIAQARVRRLGDYFAVREATYWQGVALSHPEGRQLALLLPYISSIVPPWARPTSGGPPIDEVEGEIVIDQVEEP
jgi:hypothetical protein